MKKILSLCLVLIFGFTLLGFADENPKYELEKKVTSLSLKGLDGNEFDLEKILEQDNINGVVFVFLSYKCSGSLAYDGRYVEYAADFEKKGIKFIGINSNYNETVYDLKAHAKSKNYNFPVLKDWDNVIADRFDARVTPHVFFINKNSILCYKGAIDDNRRVELVKNKVLAGVINEYLEGKEISVRETRPFG